MRRSRAKKIATDDDGAACEKGGGGEDRARKVVESLVIVFSGSARAKQAVSVTIGGPGDDSEAEMPSGWTISGKIVLEGKNTDFTGDRPIDGGIVLPMSCDINSARAPAVRRKYTSQ